MKIYEAPSPRQVERLSPYVRRRKPRSYVEWKTLHRWDALPDWEEPVPGYLLRYAREEAGLTQREMAGRLSCSQQAVAQAERWKSNPTVGFASEWARALGARFDVSLTPPTRHV